MIIHKKRIAFIGGGVSALYACKHFIESAPAGFEIHIFEKTHIIGAGMPFSALGANEEHVTNISGNEIPELVHPIIEWVQTAPVEILQRFDIDPSRFNNHKVLPRLFLGEYLSAQFHLLIDIASAKGISIHTHLKHTVLDVKDLPATNQVCIQTAERGSEFFDACLISTGHYWPKKNEGKIKGYFDSPYPPAKLLFKADHPVAIRGSSLTAIDAIRTISRVHGTFTNTSDGMLAYHLSPESKSFRIVMHSNNGMLPAIRIHTEASQVVESGPLTTELVVENRKQHNGFLSLDFVFDRAFKKPLEEKDPEFYSHIRHMNMETFVHTMMQSREQQDPFILFQKEYKEAEGSIQLRKSIYWKEMLASLSFAMNYPAKYFSAEDMLRLRNTLSELISIVIAFVPQSSAQEMLALHSAGILDIIDVDAKSKVEPLKEGGVIYHFTDEHKKPVHTFYHTFINAIGQEHLPIEAFPFKTLLNEKTITQARIQFADADTAKKEIAGGNTDVHMIADNSYMLNVSGIAINDHFQILDEHGAANERLYIMAVPYISGHNPDYSGLDFCTTASKLICTHFFMLHDKI